MTAASFVSQRDQAQAFEGEHGVDGVDVAAVDADRFAVAAGGDDENILRRAAHFAGDAGDHAVDEIGVTEHEAGAHRVHSGAADDLIRRYEFDLRQLGSVAEERFHGNADACSDGAAEIFLVGVDRAERGRCTEIDDDQRRAVALDAADGVDDAVGAEFFWIFVADLQPGFHTGFNEERRDAKINLAHAHQRAGEIWHDRRNDDLIDGLKAEAFRREKIAAEHRVLIGGAACVGGEAPAREKPVALINPHDDVGVPCIKG